MSTITEQVANLIGAKTPEQKKGKPTWRPSNVIDVIDKEPGYRYRIIEKSPRNIAKKQREGWEIVSGLSSPSTDLAKGYGRLDGGSPLTSVLEGHDYVIGRIPEDLAQARDEYINNETSRRTQSLKRVAETDLKKEGAQAHGTISMERKGVRQVIE